MAFRDPMEEEKLNLSALVGQRVAIWWDGDSVFYTCRLLTFNPITSTFMVLYDNDTNNQHYEENLNNSAWKIWDDKLVTTTSTTDKSLIVTNSATAQTESSSSSSAAAREGEAKRSGSSKEKKPRDKRVAKLSYSEMVLEAVSTLAAQDRYVERDGCSLQAIRKFLATTYNLGKQQTASFNNLTLKAINRATAVGDLEFHPKARHSYRLTLAYKRKREAKLRPAVFKSATSSLKVRFCYTILYSSLATIFIDT